MSLISVPNIVPEKLLGMVCYILCVYDKKVVAVGFQHLFQDYVSALEQLFDDIVITGTDDELFASGYLRGHFDLVVAQLELHEQADAAAIMPAVRQSVEQAKHELSPTDMAHIQALLQRLASVAVPAAEPVQQ